MRINKFVALCTTLSRRHADSAIADGLVTINSQAARPGDDVSENDVVTLEGIIIKPHHQKQTVLLHKPVGYVCSRDGQGSKTIYDLLPENLHNLNPVGRLDKDSSGLLLMTNDGELAHKLTHPSFQKQKVYEIRLNISLKPEHQGLIQGKGVLLEDGQSSFVLERLQKGNDREWRVIMKEGRNRQIRRTFSALDYTVKRLHRTQFGPYALSDIKSGHLANIDSHSANGGP